MILLPPPPKCWITDICHNYSSVNACRNVVVSPKQAVAHLYLSNWKYVFAVKRYHGASVFPLEIQVLTTVLCAIVESTSNLICCVIPWSVFFQPWVRSKEWVLIEILNREMVCAWHMPQVSVFCQLEQREHAPHDWKVLCDSDPAQSSQCCTLPTSTWCLFRPHCAITAGLSSLSTSMYSFGHLLSYSFNCRSRFFFRSLRIPFFHESNFCRI